MAIERPRGPARWLILCMGLSAGCGSSSTATLDGGQGETGTSARGAANGDGGDSGSGGCAAVVPFTPTCTDFTPCGGDPTGTWNVVGGCLGGTPIPSCSQVTESGSACVSMGTALFSGPSGCSLELNEFFDQPRIDYPTSCATCSQTLQNPSLTYGAGTYQVAFNCGQSSGMCNCGSSSFSNNMSCGGPCAGDAGTLTFSGSPSSQMRYCVTGTTMKLQDVSCGFPFLATGYLTLAKQ
jgi:hypothetical protein